MVNLTLFVKMKVESEKLIIKQRGFDFFKIRCFGVVKNQNNLWRFKRSYQALKMQEN